MIRFGMPTLIELETIEQNMKMCKDLDLSFVEINMNLPGFLPKNVDVEYYNKLKEEYGLEYTLHLPENMDPFTLNDDIRETWIEIFKESVQLARALDIKVLNMHLSLGIYFTLPDTKIYLYEKFSFRYKEYVQIFKEIVDHELKNSDVILCVENTGIYDRYFITDGLEELLKSPNIFLTWDVGHDFSAGHVDQPFIKDNIKKLKHMHIHDAKGKSNHLAIGDGEIDIKGMLEIAKLHECRCVLETKTIIGLNESVQNLKEV